VHGTNAIMIACFILATLRFRKDSLSFSGTSVPTKRFVERTS